MQDFLILTFLMRVNGGKVAGDLALIQMRGDVRGKNVSWRNFFEIFRDVRDVFGRVLGNFGYFGFEIK